MKTAVVCIAIVLCVSCVQAQGLNLDGLYLGMASKQLWQKVADGSWSRQAEDLPPVPNVKREGYMLTYSGTTLPSLRAAFVTVDSDTVQMIELLVESPPHSILTEAEEWQQTIDSTKSLAYAIRRMYPQITGSAAIDEISLETMLSSESRCNVAAVWWLDHQKIEVCTCGWIGETRRGSFLRGSGRIIVTAEPPPQRE